MGIFLLQAIELAAESLANVKFIQEKKLIGKYFDEISQDTGKYCFGVDDTLKALEMGAVETLICWENLDIQVTANTVFLFIKYFLLHACHKRLILVSFVVIVAKTSNFECCRG